MSGIGIVTGGTRGVGRTISEVLVEMGYQVFTCARGEAGLAEVARALPAVEVARVDVTDYEATRHWIDDIVTRTGTVDVLVNNAGVMAAVGPLADLNMDDWEQVFQRNLFATARICHQVIPLMMRQRRGCIVNIAGGGSAYPRRNFTAYACSKAAVVRLSDSLADELRDWGIRVNALAPGLQQSSIWRHAIEAGEQPPAQPWDDPMALRRLVRYVVATPSLTGKFLHIKDDYERIDDAIMRSDLYTLRRINP